MALSDTTPGEILSLVTVAGNPYHGLVEAGTLTLPNATTMPHPAPQGVRWYMSGRSIRVARPGWAAPQRSAAQQAADTTAGYQWLSYGLMAGEGSLFYGKPLGERKWIYIDPDGARWLAELLMPGGQTIGSMQGLVLTLRLNRFGVFGSPPEVHDYAITVPDLEQSTPVSDVLGDVAQMSDRLMDAKPDGSGALFMGYRNMDAGYFSDAALAFVEVTLSGPGSSASAAMFLRRNRAQCVGVVSETPYPSFVISDIAPTEGDAVPLWTIYLHGDNSWSATTNSNCTGENYAEGSLGFFKSIQKSGGNNPPLPTGGTNFSFLRGYELEQNAALLRTGVIVSAFYDLAGVITEITADIGLRWEIRLPVMSMAQGPTVNFRQVQGGAPGACTLDTISDGVGSVSYSKTSTLSGFCDITIRSGAAVCFQKTYSSVYSSTYNITIDYKPRLSGPTSGGAPSMRATRTLSSTLTADGHTQSGVSVGQTPSWPAFLNDWPTFDDITQVFGFESVIPSHSRLQFETVFGEDWSVRKAVPINPYLVFGNASASFVTKGETVITDTQQQGRLFVQIARLGPAVVTVLESRINPFVESGYTAVFAGQMATPGGQVTMADVTQTTLGSNDPYPPAPLRASYHPVTGDVARSFDPICWV